MAKRFTVRCNVRILFGQFQGCYGKVTHLFTDPVAGRCAYVLVEGTGGAVVSFIRRDLRIL